jgi:hypothetical protein
MSRKKMLLLVICLGVVVFAVAAQSVPEKNRGRDIAKTRLDVARKGLAQVEKETPGAGRPYDGIFIWSKRVLHAELALSGNEADKMAALEAHLTRTMRLERIAKDWFATGVIREVDLLEAEYHRLDAEFQLEEARAVKVSPHK